MYTFPSIYRFYFEHNNIIVKCNRTVAFNGGASLSNRRMKQEAITISERNLRE